MNLPEQIKKQVEAAQKVNDEFYQLNQQKPAENGEQNPTQTQAAATTQPDNTAASDQVQNGQPNEDENSETYAQRWRSLQGSFRAAQTQNRQLQDRVAHLENLIGSLQATPQQAAPAAQTYLTPKDSEEFGGDMVDFASRAAKQELAPLLAQIATLQQQLGQLQGVTPVVNRLVQNQQMSAEEKFFANISQAVPDWEAVNNNPKFHDWILGVDPMTGIQRQSYLEDAQRRFDSAQAVNIFKTWKQVSGAVPALQTQERAQPNKAQNELERQVAPGRTNAASLPAKDQQQLWTPADITQYYDDVRTGKYRGRPDEQARIERDIFQAQREGRIQRSAA